ncbi:MULTISPECIES: hypothetical protein [unclassified Flammeovirga]|uniref:hypothetical protein n=1 Tax=unclassified Flammeovirga TaxID=2637820 RepID=UPI0005C557D3|nr:MULTISPECIES: hypothetical protein [unclassified Flammeovirga]MBD0402573.1 hypothetical protein [Flammeovirga sp. EKP202]
MNDVWFQLIHNFQQYLWWWIGGLSLFTILLWVYIYFPFEKKKPINENELDDLFKELKQSKDSVLSVLENYQEILDAKDKELKDYDTRIEERENHLLLISDLPEEIELEIKLKERKHNQKMLLLGSSIGIVLGGIGVWVFLNWESVFQFIL